MVCDPYWLAATPIKLAPFTIKTALAGAFDWGCFGVVPWKWMDCQGSYESNKIEFTEPFECSFTEDSITIGHLHFTFSPK
jgi:hypothetical protein